MQFHRYDTSGEIPVRLSLAVAVTALIVVWFAPLLPERAGDEGGEGGDRRVTLIDREGAGLGLAGAGLAAAAGVPYVMRRSPMFKAAQRLAAASLAVGVLLTITTIGVFFVPSAGLMTLAATRRPPPDPFR